MMEHIFDDIIHLPIVDTLESCLFLLRCSSFSCTCLSCLLLRNACRFFFFVKNISKYVHTRSNVLSSFDIEETSIRFFHRSHWIRICDTLDLPFTSNDINFQSRGEIPISQNLISFFSVPRVIAGQEKWIITVWTNGICFNNFRLIFFSLFSFFLSFFSFFLFFFPFFFSFFFSSNRDAEKINNWQLFHWVHLILTADRLRSKPHYETKIMYKITMFLSRGYSLHRRHNFIRRIISCIYIYIIRKDLLYKLHVTTIATYESRTIASYFFRLCSRARG